MALPPVTNTPIPKQLQPAQKTGTEETEAAASPEDTVEISEAAQKKFEAMQPLSLDDPEELNSTLSNTRSLLEESSFSLGLDPSFS